MKRDKHHVSQHPKFVRGRLKAFTHFIETLPDTEDKHSPRELLKVGFVHPDIEYEVSAKTAQFGVSQSEAALTFTELTSYSTWFFIHPEKVAGKETVVTSRDFPIKVNGDRQTITDTLTQNLHTPSNTPKLQPQHTDSDKMKRLRLASAKAKALALKLKLNTNAINGVEIGSPIGQKSAQNRQNIGGFPPLDPAVYELLKTLPYEKVSGLSGLGKLTPAKGQKQPMLSFKEVDELYNAGITTEEKQAWVYYQKSKGNKMLGWDKYDTGKPSPQKIKELMEKGALFYLGGELLPYPVYSYGNIYDRLIDLEKDKEHIIDTFGQKAFEAHKKALDAAKPKEISVRAPDIKDRPKISVVSKFASNELSFKIYGLNEALVDVSLPSDAASEGISLQRAFSAWMKKLDDTQFQNVTAYEIQRYYLEARNYPRGMEEAEKELIEQYAPLEGEQLFSRFLFEALTDEDKVKLDFTWNRQYNGQSSVQYQRIPVGFECSAIFKTAPLSITPIQREGIAFMTAVGSGLIAYDVGVGKTMTANINIANALYSGKCKRPLIVVPNPTYNKWLKELFGYTDKVTGQEISGVLTGTGYQLNDWYNLGTDVQGKINLKNPVAEKSVTVITYEGFMRLGFSQKLMEGLFEDLSHIIHQTDPDKGETKRDIAKLNQKLEELIGGSNKETVVNVDDLGFDFICVDEAHNYKNVFSYVPPDEEGNKRFKFDGGQSARAQKMFFITNYIQRTYGANVMMLTATPFTNNPMEIYSMLSMVGYENMKKYGVRNLYDFMETFINQSYEYVMTYQGDIAKKHVVKSFNNRLVLQRLIYNHINYKTGEEAGVKRPCKINLPRTTKTDEKTGLPIKLPPNEQVVTYLQMTEEQQTNQAFINDHPNKVSRLEKLKAIMRCLGWSLDNALSPFIFTKETPADYKEFVEKSPKIMYTVACIRSVKEWHEKRNEPVSGQVIYMNRGKEYFKYIVEYLEKELGFKPSVKYRGATVSEVEVITSEVSQSRREIIKDAFLDGVVKVIIGTATIREGIDLQRKGTVLYNCYPDWNPTDAKQLEGRIWRQGNEYGYVRVVMPLVQDSMDVFVFQKLEEKTQRINDIWYRSDRGNVLDLDSLDTEEVKFALYTNIAELAKIALEKEQRELDNQLKILKSQIDTVNNIAVYKAGLLKYREECNKYPNNWRISLMNFLANSAENQAPLWNKTVKEMEEVRERGFELVKEIDAYMVQPQQTDRELLNLYRKVSPTVFATRYILTIPHSTFESLKIYMGAIAKAEKTVFEAKGYSMDTDFEVVKEQLVQEQNRIEELYAQLKSPENYSRITEDIIRKKQKLKVSGRLPQTAAMDFAGLNHLLAYQFNPTDSGSCIIPLPGAAPKPKPQNTEADDRERRKRLALAKAKALELKIKLLQVA
ncbi:MAG: SNF2-related protein [Bacteroidota bacterium]